MPRKYVPATSTLPYHICARSINREPFPAPQDSMWSLFEDYLFLTHHLYGLLVHGFVMMPNHFHLLATAPNGNLSAGMNFFMRETSREVSRISGRINQTYGGRYHKSLISNHHYFMNAYKYVYRNPVRAGLASFVEDYTYSTLPGLIGLMPLAIPLEEDTILFPNDFDRSTLTWLNDQPDADREDEVRKALKKSEFKFAQRNGHPSSLETNLL